MLVPRSKSANYTRENLPHKGSRISTISGTKEVLETVAQRYEDSGARSAAFEIDLLRGS